MTQDFRGRFEDLIGGAIDSVEIDRDDFSGFKAIYHDARGMIDDAKLVEYYISYRWLDLGPDDTYIDVAAQDCPFAFFVQDRFGSTVYRQDLYHLKKGIHGLTSGAARRRSRSTTRSSTSKARTTSNSFWRRSDCFEREADCWWSRCS
jgi:hypothetical protein